MTQRFSFFPSMYKVNHGLVKRLRVLTTFVSKPFSICIKSKNKNYV